MSISDTGLERIARMFCECAYRLMRAYIRMRAGSSESGDAALKELP